MVVDDVVRLSTISVSLSSPGVLSIEGFSRLPLS